MQIVSNDTLLPSAGLFDTCSIPEFRYHALQLYGKKENYMVNDEVCPPSQPFWFKICKHNAVSTVWCSLISVMYCSAMRIGVIEMIQQ